MLSLAFIGQDGAFAGRMDKNHGVGRQIIAMSLKHTYINAFAFKLAHNLVAIGIVALVVVLLALILAIGVVTLPIPIFFGVFTLSYLYRLFPDYNLINFNSADASDISGQ